MIDPSVIGVNNQSSSVDSPASPSSPPPPTPRTPTFILNTPPAAHRLIIKKEEN
jgi:hypothetical protein